MMRPTYILLFLSFFFSGFTQLPHKSSSILATGSWYKISVTKTGIHKITYDDFVSMGFNISTINTATIRVFGNGGGMLPENNSGFRFDDLREISIKVVDGNDGKLDPGDYILFYGESPDRWNYNYITHIYSHLKNLYSDYSYYFVNTGLTTGKRVTQTPSTSTLPNSYSRRFDDYAFHEIDSLSLIKSGRTWYGEVFNENKNRFEFHFSFPHIDTISSVRLVNNVVARAPVQSKFYVEYKGKTQDSVEVDFTDLQSISLLARSKQKTTMLAKPLPEIEFAIRYELPDVSATGWLDFIELTCTRNLHWVAPQMSFRDANTIGKNNITEFIMTGVDSSVVIWDVTDKENILQIGSSLVDSTLKFRLNTDTLREFIAFDKTLFYPVTLVEPVANQNLHASASKNLVIVANPLFLEEADSLAEFHRKTNALSVLVVRTDEIYNEFGSGNADPTAIRDFMKMLYDRQASGDQLRYLLLFGDGSYDPKNRVPFNNNMVPTYQSTESLKYIGTYVTDDYYGIMGDKQGEGSNGTINIGIGRLPVTTKSDASILLNKIIRYSSKNDSVMSDWRNVITFIADDEDRNLHLKQAEELAGIVKTKYPVFNVNKIYLDAYQRVQVPAGFRFPDVNKAINHTMAKGSLIINYTGHGGEDGWTAEKVLTIPDIKGWENKWKLPIFITATCEFSRFDNPERVTAGEMVLMQPDGGAIALYSTTRLALSTSNFRLDTSFFMNLYPLAGGPIPKMGDLIKISKNNNGNNYYIRNFVLLGDPAQELAYPAYNVITTEFNHKLTTQIPDTTLGLSTVSVKGEVVNLAGSRLENFNGILYPKVFDKPSVIRTLANSEDSYQQDFEMQNKVVFDGRSSVTNGGFEFSFVVPKSVMLQFGNGKISYYAKNSTTDASGFYNNFFIGGVDRSINPVNQGPEIELFMENTDFRSGDKTSSSPLMIAYIKDSNGINFINVGIGHEIIAILDNDETSPIILNDYFQQDLDNYTRGIVRFPFEDISNGRHTLRVKAWDLYNNSSVKEIYFFVSEYSLTGVKQVRNYPNPMHNQTMFEFSQTNSSGKVTVVIQVFSPSGQLLKTIQSVFTEGSQEVLSIPWDGAGENGARISSGIYFYRLRVTGANGTFFQTSQKLIILN